jgi:hypothetical protein
LVSKVVVVVVVDINQPYLLIFVWDSAQFRIFLYSSVRVLALLYGICERVVDSNGWFQKVVVDIKHRLEREIEERETEAALYNARLYETEQKESDWYVTPTNPLIFNPLRFVYVYEFERF